MAENLMILSLLDFLFSQTINATILMISLSCMDIKHQISSLEYLDSYAYAQALNLYFFYIC